MSEGHDVKKNRLTTKSGPIICFLVPGVSVFNAKPCLKVLFQHHRERFCFGPISLFIFLTTSKTCN